MSTEAVLFDFDGTIMDTNDVVINSWQHTYRTLTGRTGDRQEILATFGEPLEMSMKNLFPKVPLEVSLPIYREYQRENFINDIHLFPGIIDLLDELEIRGYVMALATSRLRSSTDQALDHFDLRKYFRSVITADDVTKHKPDPQSVNRTLESIRIDRKRAIMVGDTIHDIKCAKNAGIRIALVSWSLTLRDAKMEDFDEHARPDFILAEPADMIGIL